MGSINDTFRSPRQYGNGQDVALDRGRPHREGGFSAQSHGGIPISGDMNNSLNQSTADYDVRTLSPPISYRRSCSRSGCNPTLIVFLLPSVPQLDHSDGPEASTSSASQNKPPEIQNQDQNQNDNRLQNTGHPNIPSGSNLNDPSVPVSVGPAISSSILFLPCNGRLKIRSPSLCDCRNGHFRIGRHSESFVSGVRRI